MTKLLHEVKDDVNFVKSHEMQPRWYKVLKAFILLGFLIGYGFLFGLAKTMIFMAAFLFLMLAVHILYRVKTNKWRQSWLDFVVVEENNEIRAKSIGKFYYSAIIVNAIVSIIISQVVG